MNPPRTLLPNAAVLVALLFMLPAAARAQQTIESTNRAGIKLSYIAAAKLDELELRRVLWLAQQVGVTNVAKVSTDYARPTAMKLVSVTSKERVDGRNISYETVTINRTDWGGGNKPQRGFQSGDFWVVPSDKVTWLQRTFDIGGTTRRITLREKDIPVADKAIPLIVAKKVRFKNEIAGVGFDRISLLQPAGLERSFSTDDYELWLHTSQEVIQFRYENGEVVITGIGRYDI